MRCAGRDQPDARVAEPLLLWHHRRRRALNRAHDCHYTRRVRFYVVSITYRYTLRLLTISGCNLCVTKAFTRALHRDVFLNGNEITCLGVVEIIAPAVEFSEKELADKLAADILKAQLEAQVAALLGF